MLKNQKNNQVYFKIIISIVLVIILAVLISAYNNEKDKPSTTSNPDNSGIFVRDATELDTPSNRNNTSFDSTNQNLGPATLEDLGGATGSTNIDQLLEGKEIDIGK